MDDEPAMLFVLSDESSLGWGIVGESRTADRVARHQTDYQYLVPGGS